jgi:hypothetical protein
VTYKWAKLFYSSQTDKEKGKNYEFFESGFSKTFERDLQLTHGFFSLNVTYKWAKLLCFQLVACLFMHLSMFILLSLVLMSLHNYGALIFLLGHLGPSTADACVLLLLINYCMLYSC